MSPIHEPGLQELIQTNVEATRIEFTLDAEAGIEHGLFPIHSGGALRLMKTAQQICNTFSKWAKAIGQHMHDYKVIVNKSTVPVGTAKKVAQAVQQQLDSRKLWA